VPKREGKIRTLKKIHPGYIVQDNNLLACPKKHVRAVFEMLRTQKNITFRGGLDVDYMKDWVIEELRSLNIRANAGIFIACDAPAHLPKVCRALDRLMKAGFKRNAIRCYVLTGFKKDTLEKAEARMREIWEHGALPFPQVYDQNPDPGGSWRRLARTWQRPAIARRHMALLAEGKDGVVVEHGGPEEDERQMQFAGVSDG
jgi:hypothetical protein